MSSEITPTPPPLISPRQGAGNRLKWVLIIFAFLLTIGAVVAYLFLYPMYVERKAIVAEKVRGKIIHIPTHIGTLEQLADWLEAEKIISDKSAYLQTAQRQKQPVVVGSYRLAKDVQSARDLVRVLRPQKRIAELVLHNIRTKEQLAGVLGKKLEADSAAFVQFFNDSMALAASGFRPQTVMAAFVPNTYELYWAGTPAQTWERMLQEYNKFWTAERLQKAKALNMSPQEVYTLASIVETESQYKPERTRIAGVYLNRLREKWALQADPTVIFAVGDFEIRRVLRSHLETISPYNTYLNTGLPPGPIYMASVDAIDAVLNYEQHKYMFFCARPDGSGAHAFAETLAAHNANARAYHAWISKQ